LKEFSKTPLQESRKKGVVLNIHAHAGKPDFKIKGFSKWQNAIEVEVKAFPQKGNANAEIEKKLGEFFQASCTLLSGFSSSKKRVLVNAELKKVAEKLESLEKG